METQNTLGDQHLGKAGSSGGAESFMTPFLQPQLNVLLSRMAKLSDKRLLTYRI